MTEKQRIPAGDKSRRVPEVGRTAHVRQLKEALAQRPLAYLGGNFGSGKTVLMEQLAASMPGETLRLTCRDGETPQHLAGVRAGTPLLILLDDAQDLTDANAQGRLAAALTRLPDGVRAVLAGWAPMPAWLKPLYAAGLLTMLGQDFLNFTREEAEQFLIDRQLFPDTQALDAIMKSGGGWALFLSLYTVRLAEQPDASPDTLQALMRSDLFDCFGSVVYVTFDQSTRNLLCHLAPFPSFTSAMAKFVSGSRDAPALLARLSQECGFLCFTPPDAYAFAPLLRDYLLALLQSSRSDGFIDQQYNNAALYYELEANLPEALRYYRLAGNLGKITELLSENARTRPGSGHYLELKEYYAMLPEAVILSSPELMTGMCVLHSLALNVKESERWFTALEDFAAHAQRRDPRYALAQESLAYLRICLPHRGIAGMPAILRSTARMVLTAGFSMHEVNVAGNCPSLLNGGKDFCPWLAHARKLYALLKRPCEIVLGVCGVGMADIALGEALYETSVDESCLEAMAHLNAGLAEAESHGDAEIRFAATGVLCRLFASQGSLAAAQTMLAGFRDRLPGDAPGMLARNAEALAVRLAMLSGDRQTVRDWMGAAPDELKQFVTLERYRYLTKVRGYVIQGQWNEALNLLERLGQYYALCQRPYGQAETELLTAVICQRSRQGVWQDHFRAALATCEKYGLIRLMADEGIAVVDMAVALIPQDTPWRVALLARVKQQARLYPRYLTPAQGGKENLTDTEHAVYQLLITGRRNEEIASVLGVTLRTVKFHTANIYRKLGVQNRAQAVKRAAELGDL